MKVDQMFKVIVFSLGLLISAFMSSVSWADESLPTAEDVYAFDTPEQQYLFEHLIEELRCPKCQNQNLMDSNADISKYMKNKIHKMILQGKSKTQVVDELRLRYGDFITYKPPFNFQTAILWLLPLLLLCFALLAILVRLFGAPRSSKESLTQTSQEKLSHEEEFSLWLKKNKKEQ